MTFLFFSCTQDIKAALAEADMKFEKLEKVNGDLCAGELIGPLQYRVCRRMRDVMYRTVLDSITIDSKTAHPDLTVAGNGTILQWINQQHKVPDNPEQLIWYSALGLEGFTSGRHYWEVEVGGDTWWSLGVAKVSVERRNPICDPVFQRLYCISIYSNTQSLIGKHSLTKIGVYLDYEGGQVSFYNAEDMSLVHMYADTFTEKMYPYFSTKRNINEVNHRPLKLITPNN
nr:PREDICTED: zinc-binding protein A33-like [Latimeria chalumnae]|eukprot:XP_014345223.1 PREDICTED: zinc-binding protein A33-like [Latimeria chalumnae]